MKRYFLVGLSLAVIAICGYILTGIDLTGTVDRFVAIDYIVDIQSFHIHDDHLYIGASDGLYVLEGSEGSYALMSLPLEKDLTFIRAMYTDPEGNLWIGSTNGLCIVDKAGEERYFTHEAGQLPHNTIYAFYEKSPSEIWIGTEDGIAVYDRDFQYISSLTREEGLYSNMSKLLFEDAYDGIWSGSYQVRAGGISRYEDGQWTYYTKEDLVNVNTTSYVFIDDETLWVGGGLFEEGGITIFTYQSGKWQATGSITQGDGLAGEKVRSLYAYKDRIYIGSEYDGITVTDAEGSFETYTVIDGLTHNEVKCFMAYKNQLFLGTKAGLCYLPAE